MQKEYSVKRLILYFLKLGTFGFGGSVALAHAMQNDWVEKNQWISQKQFLRGLTLSQLAPGPLAAQLAIYLGFIKSGVPGATLAGIAFVLPSFLLVLVLAIIYTHFSDLSLLQSALYGIGAAVIGIIASSGYALTRRTIKRKMLIWIIYIVAFLATIVTKSTNVFIFIGAGLITMFLYNHEKLRVPKDIETIPFLLPFIGTLPSTVMQPIIQLFFFFLMAGTIAFGGGLAIVPFLQNGVVNQFHWLTNKQFVDAVSIAMITPGPVVIAATFIGYLTANLPGALIATIAIFLPVYLIVLFFAPFFDKHAENPKMIAFIEGVLAAAMASIAGSVVLLGEQAINDASTLFLATSAFVATKYLKIPSIVIIVIAGLAGIFLRH